MAIKNIIFDLGGVILDIDAEKTQQAFEALGIDIWQVATADFWKRLNAIGNYSLTQFSDLIRQETQKEVSDEEVEQAWTALLCDFDEQRMNFLTELSKTYQLYLFSNTDEIHTKAFENKCLTQFDRELSSYFTQVFYSQRLGLRKPDVRAFEKVLLLSKLTAEETLFVDDKGENCAAARSVGLHAFQLQAPELLTDLPAILVKFDEIESVKK
ncbi:HAD family hydrolase [Lactococcus cremoris]|uniref:HAD family phosphatase n=1 Tax=Lactococcus cremoris subsp. tructae TaxID=542833 RepID=A0A2A5SPK1_LACLC|nr:HAD family phosphatase [Lactococcus cremoris]PCS15860.1 hypothetical protein RU92_GL001188 [Lactococcus cremoris subsp. tructae]